MMKNYLIPRLKVLELYTNTIIDTSISDLSEWVKYATNNQFIVIERVFVLDVIAYIELNKYSDGFLGRDIKEKWDLKAIKSYI